MKEVFFELIRVAIGTQETLSRLPSAREWGKLYKMARKQSLVGVCFAGLKRLGADADDGFANIGMSKMQYLTWMGQAVQIQQKNELVNRQCAELQAKLSADGYRSYIMKGQANASLYKVGNDDSVFSDLPALRQSGDIDVYIEGGLEKVLACADKYGGATGVNELEMHVKVFEDTEVEFHYRPFIMRNPFRNARLQRFFSDCAEKNFSNSVILDSDKNIALCAPTTEFNLVHQMVHIYHHLFTEGVGMRQLMDYYFVLKTLSSSPLKGECMESTKKVINDLGLDTFASALMWVMQYVFGLGMIGMPWVPNQRDGEFLLKEIMLSGNFGKQDKRQKGLYDSKWNSFWIVNGKALRLARFDRWMWFWGPFWRVYHFVWRKAKRFE